MAIRKKRYGWIPSKPDHRDFKYKASLRVVAKLPTAVDLRNVCPDPYDQGELGSCTGNAIAGALEIGQIRDKWQDIFTPSRLFIYYNERVIENTVNEDSGAEIRDGMKSLNTWGFANENLWPYDISKFTIKPADSVYAEAANHKVVQYYSVAQVDTQLKAALAQKMPVVFGFTVYESFESDTVAKTGIVPMPKKTESVLGGHAVVIVGYDDTKKRFLVRNSWGKLWALAGYCWFPYAYILSASLASDFWVIKKVP